MKLYWNDGTRRTAAALLLALYAPMVGAGNLDAEINSMFNNLGAVGNYTAPGAFHGQAMNTFSGGSLSVRIPNKRYQLTAIAYPYVRASCSGIDAYGGAFSLISGSQLKDMLKKVTSALPAVAFQLALEAVTPMFGSLTKHFQMLQQFASNSSRSSCELATSLVGSAADMVGYQSDKACRAIAQDLGLASDATEAESQCTTDKASILNQGKTSAVQAIKSQVPFVGNLVWEGLANVPVASGGLDDEEKQLIMNMVGTVIYHPVEDGKDAERLDARLTSINQILHGDDSASGAPPTIEMWRCDETVHCANPRLQVVPFTPITAKVRGFMQSLLDHLRTRTPIPNDSPEVGFVNISGEPVYRMLSIASTSPDDSVALSLMDTYQEVLAADYGFQLLRRELAVGLIALDKKSYLNPIQADDARALQQRISALVAGLQQEKTAQYAIIQTVDTMSTRLESLSRQMRRNVPDRIGAMLGRAAWLQR
ncbi:conjugal transfer protein TraH [Rugamonas aquatica]|uniref:Conjugal transfer protein TraH n=1 Tax=Rugamonas aquatica TaxID=2743357 RepID=A0A6A7N630_9BURK|nr:conjugal transfer protein TraH [Rugamonas aquatica]MQA40585.1 conjugal transfer protein TraH [Rugamonas aquatica]